MRRIFSDWPYQTAAKLGRSPVTLSHSLADDPLFSDEGLARLIEASPRDRFHVNTMPRETSDPRNWREGDIRGLSGEKVISAVAKGNLWLHLQRVNEGFPAYQELLDAAFAEMQAHAPGFRSYKRSMSVLISSPRMNVAYHADVPGQSLWQLRGRKRLWIYPARAPFLPQRAIENIVLKRASDTELPYDASFDDSAEVLILKPGDMATWPRNCPHRVVNEDCLNVSFTAEHWTSDLRAAYAVDYANGLLRRMSGDRDLSRSTRGPAFLAKFAIAGAHKALRGRAKRGRRFTVDFEVDPSAARGFVDVAPYQIAK
jgi:hypothetical protein